MVKTLTVERVRTSPAPRNVMERKLSPKLVADFTVKDMNEFEVNYQISPPVTNDELNALFADAWEKHTTRDFLPVLRHSLLYVCARLAGRLIGFVNVAWDGAQHAFILDTTVDKDFQRHGVGVQLVKRAAEASRKCGVEWLHVDFEPYLEEFYRKCGFRQTNAGLMNLKDGR